MIKEHFDVCVKKIDKEMAEPYGKYNSDGDFIPYTWDELAQYFNEFEKQELYKSGDYLRCLAKQERYKKGMIVPMEDALFEQKEKIYIETAKLRKHRVVLNKKLKELASHDTFKEIMTEVASNFDRASFKTPDKKVGDGSVSMILNLCDWHYGLHVENFLNTYNKKEFDRRIQKLIDEAYDMCEKYNVEVIYINNLNDLISGYIHTSIRLMNDDDTMTQLMYVIDTLCNMIQILSEVAYIEYREVTDNHSRMSAKKEESLNAENLSRMISFTLEKVFKGNDRFKVVKNDYSEDIATFSVYGFNYAAVHGHLDKISSVVQDISLMTREFYSAIFMAHKHHYMADEIHGTYVYSSGCLVGTDDYSKDLRASSIPSQNIFLVTPEDPIYLVRTIKF